MALELEGCPESLSGESGEMISFEAFVILSTMGNSSPHGPVAWSFGVAAEGGSITGIEVEGLEVRTEAGLRSLSQTNMHIADLAEDPGDPNRRGAVSAIWLTARINAWDWLLSEGRERIAKVTVEAVLPAAGETRELRLQFVDGLKGEGNQPVLNVVTLDGYSQTPALGNCMVRLESRPAGSFLRGDCDCDGQVRGVVTDAVFLLNFNFLGGSRPSCFAACDANADGQVSGVVTDAVYLLTFNFLGGPAPPEPFPACGQGTEADLALGCETASESCVGE